MAVPPKAQCGCTIALLGPNGCGKTTVANLVADELKGKPFQEITYLHKRSLEVLPRLKTLRPESKQRRPRGIPRGTPSLGMVRPLPRWRVVCYALYYALDYALSYRRVRRIRRESHLVIFDRFFYDYYYHRRNRRAPIWLIDILCWFVPVPDLVIHLDRSAEEIHQQKPELLVDEIKFQQERIRSFIEGVKTKRVIDASQGATETARRVCEEVRKVVG